MTKMIPKELLSSPELDSLNVGSDSRLEGPSPLLLPWRYHVWHPSSLLSGHYKWIPLTEPLLPHQTLDPLHLYQHQCQASSPLRLKSSLWLFQFHLFSQFSSVAQPCPTLWNPMDCSKPGFPIYHQLLDLAQTHVHWVGDAIQPPYPVSSRSPLAFNLFQHQGFL